jgi:hypothetical protein
MDNKCKLCVVQAKLIKCLDRLLVCYRVGKNPGNTLDDICKHRQKIKELSK